MFHLPIQRFAANSQGSMHQKIVVIGGSGLIGSKTVAILRQGGHEVVAASPESGVNTITGEGLKEDAAVVVDAEIHPAAPFVLRCYPAE